MDLKKMTNATHDINILSISMNKTIYIPVH